MNPTNHERRGTTGAAATLILVLMLYSGASPAFAAGSDGIIEGFKEAVGDIYFVIEVLLGLTILSMFIMGGVRAVKKGEISEGISTIVLGIFVIVAFYLVAEQFRFSSNG